MVPTRRIKISVRKLLEIGPNLNVVELCAKSCVLHRGEKKCTPKRDKLERVRKFYYGNATAPRAIPLWWNRH